MCSVYHLLLDVPKDKIEEMLIKKIQQCSYVFDFSDPMTELRAKEIKRAALNEVLEYIANNKGVITEPVYPEVVRMVSLISFNILYTEVS